MGHNHLKTIDKSIPFNNNKLQDTYRVDLVSTWMFLYPYTKNFSEGNKNGNFLTWIGLNNQQLLKYITPNIATDLVHMDQDLKKLQSSEEFKSELGIEENNFFT